MICYAKLNISTDIIQLQKEVRALLQTSEWLPHFNNLHYSGSWTVLPLRTPDGDSNNPFADLMNTQEFKDTPLLNLLPSVKSLVTSLQCEQLSVRLLNLKAHSLIKPHRDRELAFEKGEARLHFPIFSSKSVEFFVENDFLKMEEGQCWYINANLTHRAANKGESDRIHLVVDCRVNDWLSGVFEKAEKQCREEKKDRDTQLLIIENLRMQNTEAALALASKLESELNL